jgi:hypothetical protein
MTPLSKLILDAMERIRQTPLCCEMLSENLIMEGGIERFFQRMLLWSFNRPKSPVYANVEIKVAPLSGNQKIDFVCFPDPQSDPALVKIFQQKTILPRQWAEFSIGFVEMKQHWNRKEIASDLKKLRAISEANQSTKHEFYELLIIENWTLDSHYDLPGSIRRHTAETFDVLSRGVRRHEIVGQCRVLDNVPNPSDGSARTTLDAILVRCHF